MDKKQDAFSSPQVQSLVALAAKSFSNAAFPSEVLAEGKLRFDDIEDLAVRIGDAVSRKVVEHAVTERAQQLQQADQTLCSRCNGPCEPVDPNPKILLSRRGEVCWIEPAHECKKCRRAFFPSVQRIGP